jgi:hypothetical protein
MYLDKECNKVRINACICVNLMRDKRPLSTTPNVMSKRASSPYFTGLTVIVFKKN